MKTEILFAERGRAAEALQQSEERYRRLLRATTDYVYTVEVQNGVSGATRHGPGCASVTGYTAEEFSNDPLLWYRVIHEADRPAVLEQINRILTNELPPPLEHRIIHKNGEIRWIENTPIPRRNAQGWLTGYDGLIKDITPRKRAEERLDSERLLLRTLIDNVPDCVFVKDTESRFLLNNVAHLRIMGAANQHEALGKDDTHYFPPELAARYRADERAVISAGQALENREEPVVDSAGHKRWFLTTKVPLKNLQGAVVGLVGIARDITEHRLAEERVRESQERLALVIQGSNDGIWDWDVTTGQTYFSPRWKSMIGYEDHEIANNFSSWERLLHPEDRSRAIQQLQDYFSGRSPRYELEARLRHKDGSYRWILARGVVLRDAQGKPLRMLGSHVDLTERKQAAERLQQAYARLARRGKALTIVLRRLRASHRELQATQLQLIQAAKLESLGTLAAGVAHEVKNPLMTILMGLDYLCRKIETPSPELTQTLEDMREATRRANSIVHELLAMSAETPFHKTPQDLNLLLERSLSLLNAEVAKSQCKVQRALAPELPAVPMDPGKLEQVLLNLILNALQAMPKQGTLTLRTQLVTVPADPLSVSAVFRGFTSGKVVVLLEIQDTGSGIPESDLSKVFDPFFTTKPVGIGTGLGLSVAKKIIDLHGGAIELANSPAGGAVARIVLSTQDGGPL